MKKEYVKPEVLVVTFKVQDIVTASAPGIILPDDEWSLRMGN